MSYKEDPRDRCGLPVYEVREVGDWWAAFINGRCMVPHILPGGTRREAMRRLLEFLRHRDPEALQAWRFEPHSLRHPAVSDFVSAKRYRPVYDLRQRPDENWSIFRNGRFFELTPTRDSDVAMRRLKTFVRENDPGAAIAKRIRFIRT